MSSSLVPQLRAEDEKDKDKDEDWDEGRDEGRDEDKDEAGAVEVMESLRPILTLENIIFIPLRALAPTTTSSSSADLASRTTMWSSSRSIPLQAIISSSLTPQRRAEDEKDEKDEYKYEVEVIEAAKAIKLF
ncbi:hypothetical protein AK830_g6823 [Neonectria ditissima]|uniref:Uncharacterized protein n=1 Tax=Neonectria ditissima TaxID=78410 RepID=A0A0P7B116_9HYPO|nr:hypothetical protein AK830_g6823 [Neonectria ditissima]